MFSSPYFLLLTGFASMTVFAQPAELKHLTPSSYGVRILINSAITVVQGTPEDVVPVRSVRIVFDYSEMTVCNHQNMEEYLQYKTRKYSPEKAAKYKEEWEQKTKMEFEPRFKEYFDKKAGRIGMMSYDGPDTSGVKLVVKFKRLEPHSHSGENNNVPYAYMYCQFVGNEGQKYVTYELTAFGSRDNNDADRVAECYAIAGKMLGGKDADYIIKR